MEIKCILLKHSLLPTEMFVFIQQKSACVQSSSWQIVPAKVGNKGGVNTGLEGRSKNSVFKSISEI